ncbi:MAG: hypothetical protein Crog4KO_28750 [Crocinitomicaceae bacterium]
MAQNKLIDSLEQELRIHNQQDTVRIRLLNELALHHYRNNPEKSIEYATQAGKLADDLNFVKGKARSLYAKGAYHIEQANFKKGAESLKNAIALYTSIENFKEVAKCENGLGVLFYYKGDYEQSIKHYEESLRLKLKLGINDNKALIYNIGNLYSVTGEHEKALLNFEKALKMNRKLKDQKGILNCLNSIGSLYYAQGNYPLALKYFKESLEVAKKANDAIGKFQSYLNTGNVYRMQNLNDKALSFYQKALSIKNAHHNVRNITAVKNNIAGIYSNVGDYKAAIVEFKESIALSEGIDDAVNLMTAINGLGFVYLEMNKQAKAKSYFQKAYALASDHNSVYDLLDSYHGLSDSYYRMANYDSAFTYAQYLLNLSDEQQFLRHQKNAHSLLYEVHKKKRNYEKALEHHEFYKALSDSFFNEENIQKLSDLEFEYKYKQELESGKNREQKLTKTVKEVNQDLKETQKNIFKGIIAFLLVIILLGGFVFYLRLRNVKSKIQNITTEQKLLRSQMTPHFIFNSMSILQGMILNKEDRKAVSYLSKFSRLLRLTLENSREKTVGLDQELLAVRHYLDLQNVEEKSPFIYEITVDRNIDSERIKISPMLIQPFVENAIEHAFEDRKENRRIDISLELIGQELICVVKDNGIGVAATKSQKSVSKKSLSTTITSERLKILSRDFKMCGAVSIEDRKLYQEQGTIVRLTIPYIKEA